MLRNTPPFGSLQLYLRSIDQSVKICDSINLEMATNEEAILVQRATDAILFGTLSDLVEFVEELDESVANELGYAIDDIGIDGAMSWRTLQLIAASPLARGNLAQVLEDFPGGGPRGEVQDRVLRHVIRKTLADLQDSNATGIQVAPDRCALQ